MMSLNAVRSIFDKTPKTNSRRSSSHHSRKSTREPESNKIKMAQTSYSLPPTPIASSFEESVSSTKRRKSQRPLDLKDPQPEKATKTPVQKKDDVSASESKSDVKTSSRHRKSDKPNGHAANEGDSQGQLMTPTTSNSKRKSQAPPSQLNLRTSLKDPQMKGKSLATEAELANSSKNKTNSKSSTVNPTTTQNDRKARKSMPAKLNGVNDKKDTVHPKSSVKASASRPSTPARIDHKAKPTSQPSAKATKAASNGTQATPAKPAIPVAPKTEKADLATPAARADTNSRNSTARSRRRDRKSTTATDRNIAEHIQETATKHNRNLPVQIQETPSQPPSVPDPNLDATQPLSHNINTRSSRAKTAAKLLAVDKSLDSPAAVMVLETTPYNGEVADSVEGTPMQAYGDNFHFEYGPEMYGNGFGLDGQVDGPGSPTSLSTGTSVAARTSSRIRKPTIKALESLESERQFRRSRAPSNKPESTSGEGLGQKKGGAAQPEHHVPASAQVSQPAAQQCDTTFIARRLLGLVEAAVSADPALDAGLDARLESLRREFEAEQRGQDGEGAGAGPEGESRPTSSMPFGMDKTKVSESWTDEDGWTHTGLLNKFGEEYVFVSSDYEWVHPTNTYGDDQLPQPPGRFRSREQAEKDRIFGYPPRLGERNLPQQTNLPFRLEDVDEEKAKVKARDGARLRGIPVDRTMSAAEIEALIAQYDNAGEPAKEKKPASSLRKRRRTEPVNDTTDSPSGTKRRRQIPSAPSPAAAAPAPATEKPSLKVKFKFSNPEKAAAAAAIFQPMPSSQSKKRLLADVETDGEASSRNRRKPSPDTASTAEQNLTPNGRPRRRAATALMADFQSHAEERARRAARKKAATPSKRGGGNPGGEPMKSA